MADFEQLILTLSADMRQIQRALDRLLGDTKKAADGIENASSIRMSRLKRERMKGRCGWPK